MVRHEISDGQESMWTAQEIRFISSEAPGPVVDIANRAEELTGVMKLINQNSQAAGLAIAGATDSPYRSDLEQSYGRNTDRVIDGATQRAREREIRIKDTFARATGMYALMRAGFDLEEVRTVTRDMFQEFTAKYGVGNANAASRRRDMSVITRSASTITGRRLGAR